MEEILSETKPVRREKSKLVQDIKEISLATQVHFSMDSRKGFYFRCYTPEQISLVTEEIDRRGYDFKKEYNYRKYLIYISENKKGIGEN